MFLVHFFRSAARATAAGAALAAVVVLAHPANAQVAVTVDGNSVTFVPAPMMEAGRVFVPLRGVFERLGASVVYSSGTINATGNGRTISLQIGSNQATVNGEPQTIDVAPFIVGASTYVPLRFVSQALGAGVNWDDADRVVEISTAGGSAPDAYVAPVSDDDDVAIAPPPIPVYEQPDVPAPNEIWQPGYWAYGAYGYYWVPGTWVEPPQTGYLWTPGYWAWNDGRYVWNGGYWATAVGYYGGVNYGAGYYGHGYVGGRWDNDTFRYNTAVSHVNVTIVNTVYVDRTVYVNEPATRRPSYNGGPSGVTARPQPAEAAVAKAPHLGMTPAQQQHVEAAAHDRSLQATVNHDQPPVTAVAHPLSPSNLPADVVPPAPARPAPGVHAAPAPAFHPAPPAPVAPVQRPVAPPARAPEVRAAPPADVPPVRQAVPVTRPPEAPAAPPVHAPPAPVRPPAVFRVPTAAPAPPAVRVAPPVRVAPAAPPAPPVAAPAQHPAPAPHANPKATGSPNPFERPHPQM